MEESVQLAYSNLVHERVQLQSHIPCYSRICLINTFGVKRIWACLLGICGNNTERDFEVVHAHAPDYYRRVGHSPPLYTLVYM